MGKLMNIGNSGFSISKAAGRPADEGLPSVYVYRKNELIWNKVLPMRLFNELVEVLDDFDDERGDGQPAEAGEDALSSFFLDAMSNVRRSAQA